MGHFFGSCFVMGKARCTNSDINNAEITVVVQNSTTLSAEIVNEAESEQLESFALQELPSHG